MKHWSLAELSAAQTEAVRPYLEFLRVESMSAGLYVLAAGADDRQSPHTEDEIYFVMAGRSRFTSGGQEIAVGQGDTIFVPAHEEHRFPRHRRGSVTSRVLRAARRRREA